MFLKTRNVAISFFILILVAIILISVAIYRDYHQKFPKVPTRQSSSLYQHVELTDDRVHLIVVGDMGLEGTTQKGVADSIERRCKELKPGALVFLGDNIYQEGVESVNDPAWDKELMQYYQGSCIRDVPIYALLGNHDYRKSAQAQIDYTQHNKRWNMPFRFYEVSFGDLLSLTIGDSWFPDYCFASDKDCSINFMMESLNRNKEKNWRIVASHYPIRSASARSGNHTGGIKGYVLEHLLCNNNTLPTTYMSGHAHHLEHSISPKCDMDLIVSGTGGGSKLAPVKAQRTSRNKFAQSINGFAEITADVNSIEYSFYDSDSKQLYSQTRTKPKK